MKTVHTHLKTLQPLWCFICIGLFMSTATAFATSDALIEELDGNVFRELRNGSNWQLERSRKLRSQEDVLAYLNQLNSGQFQDWRLPTKSELYRLLEIFDWKNNGDIQIKVEGSYWLSEQSGNIAAGEWELGDMCGPVRTFYPGKSGYVRAIRP